MSSLEDVSLKGSRKRLQGSYFNVNEVIDDYLAWLEQIFYVLVYRFNYNEGKYEYGAFRSPKRGDCLYAERVLRKFDSLSLKLSYDLYFRHRDRLNIVVGRVLYLVLEYDLNRFSLLESWERCGVDLNRYMTYLRRHFGKCSIIRCYEAHESALCHINLVVFFHDRAFQGRRYKKRYSARAKDSKKVFKSSRSAMFSNFYTQRKRAADKLQNPRLLKITFHTLRRWRGTREYEKTRDPIHVRDFLGHNCLKNTEIYIHPLKSGRQEYHVKATKDEKEAIELAEQGFKHWHTVNGLHIFRKLKY